MDAESVSQNKSSAIESPEMEAYEKKLTPTERKDVSGVRMLLREARKSRRGDKKRNWKSIPNSNRGTIRKPSPDGDVQLRDWA
jgi:hypothetical protein